MASPFDTEINTSYHVDKFDTQSSLVNDVIGGVGATIVDAAASIWNSLPGTTEVDTADLLSGISDNALRVYEEHPDTIQTASFIAGSLIPGGLAIKGLNAVRNGSRAVSWFTKAGKTEDMATITRLFSEGAANTSAYRSAVRGMYAKTAVNQAIDAAAFEVAALGVMNAHPFVEDYMKDPVTNFGISVLLGGALGGAVGAIADSHAVKTATGGLMEDALNFVMGKSLPINPTAPNAANLMASYSNIGSYTAIIEDRAKAGLSATNDLLTAVATTMKTQAIKESDDLFELMLPAEMTKLPQGVKEVMKANMARDAGLIGVETMRLVGAKDLSMTDITKLSQGNVLTTTPILKNTVSSAGPKLPEAVESVRYTDADGKALYGTKESINNLAGAVVFGQTPEQMAKDLPFGMLKTPNMDSNLELMGRTAADVERRYIAVMEKVDKASIKEIKAMGISITDGPLLTALIARAERDPEVAAAAFNIFDRTPVYKKILETKTEQLVTGGVIQKTGPTSTYQAAVDKIGGNGNADFYRPKGHGNADASAMLSSWIGGNVNKMRKAAVDYYDLKFGGFGASRADTTAASAFGALVESPQSVQLRKEFKKLADADGNVYLYRGSKVKGAEQGHAPVVSYTTHASKAAQFGTTRLFKVHVDDILMGFEDVGGGSHNAEILVRAGSRAEEATGTATVATAGSTTSTTTTTQTIMQEVDGMMQKNVDDLKTILLDQKKEAIDTLLANGVPIKSIALKTNTPESIVMQYANSADKEAVELFFLGNGQMYNLNTIGSPQDFAKVLDPTLQPVILKGNMRKNPYVDAVVAHNNKSTATINSEITAASLFASRNKHVNAIGDAVFGAGQEEGSVRYYLDIIKAELGKGNNAFAGKALINSFDFFTRNMGHLGPMISDIGRKVAKIRNNFIEEVNIPLAEHMTKISKSKAETIEFNTFREVNAGLKGWRGFQKNELTGEWNLVQKVDKLDGAGKKVVVLEPVPYQGAPYKVVSQSVIDTINYIQEVSPKLLDMANTSKRIIGANNVNDIGLWIPSFNPINKFVAYVHGSDNSTKILWANTLEEHQQVIRDYAELIKRNGLNERIIEKGVDQQMWSKLNGRVDVMHMEQANTALQKGGSSAAANIRTDTQVFGEIAQGYEHYINSEMRTLTDLAMSDITDQLSKMSQMNRGSYDSQPLSLVKKITQAPKDAAATLRNTLLGNPNLGEYEGWKTINQSFETALSFGVNAVDSIWSATVKPLTNSLIGKTKTLTPEAMAKVDYEVVMKEMKEKGIVVWSGFDDAAAKERGFAKLEDSPDISKRLVYASNALAATMLLRVGELAQPLVNMMSLPILSSLAIGSKMPETFMGVAKGTANVSPVKIMYEGMRASSSPHFAKLEAKWIELGYFDSVVSEANKSLGAARSMNSGAIAATEKLMDSNIIKWASWTADKSEMLVRRQTMFTGAVLAKRLYPELDDVGVTIFARDFMDKAVGNFEASQRPVFFQGTLGVALGLFQTYSVTLAQNMYRQLELKNYKNLAKGMLAQSTIFGTSSMPGFKPVSDLIGEHYSDDHYDLISGTYRALPDAAAEAVLYGLPSLAGTGIQSRGDSNFRMPGAEGIVAVNVAKQITGAVGTVASAMGEGSNAGSAIMQALSLQNMSRPIARTAEIINGYSVTRAGNTVQTPEEVWTTTGIMSRVMGVRPLEETKLREAMHLNTYYGSIDYDNRQSLMYKLRNDIRAGTLTDEGIAQYGEEYLRQGGSPTGWRAAVRTALGRTDTSGKETFVDKLKPNSPFMYMMDNL